MRSFTDSPYRQSFCDVVNAKPLTDLLFLFIYSFIYAFMYVLLILFYFIFYFIYYYVLCSIYLFINFIFSFCCAVSRLRHRSGSPDFLDWGNWGDVGEAPDCDWLLGLGRARWLAAGVNWVWHSADRRSQDAVFSPGVCIFSSLTRRYFTWYVLAPFLDLISGVGCGRI